MATAQEIQHEITRILDQGAEAVNQVILAYIEKRTPERDLNWLCLQMGKEFGAIMLHSDKAKEAIRNGADGRQMDAYFETVKEEVAHFQAYYNLVNRTIGENAEIPVPDIYRYVVANIENGQMALDDSMLAMKDRWPEHHKYLAGHVPYIKTQHPWVAKIFGATLEGAAGGWHWCMSQLPPHDDFFKQAAKLQEGIAIDELEHGPEELAELCQEYSDDFGVDLDELYRQLRLARCQEVRQRNEQFLDPLSEAEVAEICDAVMNDTLSGFTLYRKAA
ncbi:MAG TPA: hypothetical protein DCF45_09045 [Gammaproteobacteria bacterium]|nr:hypothetical protein [Gammaproteobacteria bacterium]